VQGNEVTGEFAISQAAEYHIEVEAQIPPGVYDGQLAIDFHLSPPEFKEPSLRPEFTAETLRWIQHYLEQQRESPTQDEPKHPEGVLSSPRPLPEIRYPHNPNHVRKINLQSPPTSRNK
jgi:hypothetical protein